MKIRNHENIGSKIFDEIIIDSEERYRELYRSSIDGFLYMDLNGIILECNQALVDMQGYSHDELNQLNFKELIPRRWRDIVQNIVKEQLNTRGYSDVLEIEGLKKDGEIFPASVRVWLSKDQNKKPTGMWAIVRDTTERKKLEKKLRAYTETLKKLDEERAEELRLKTIELQVLNKELEAFSYSVSHDLRAPLRSIDGFSKALLEDYAEILDMQGKDYLQRVRAASQRMAELIEVLLSLSRITRTEMQREPVDLSKLAQEIATGLQETQPERHVDFIIEPDLVAIGDEQLLKIMLENLLGNAWKFTGKKSIASIEFGTIKQKGEIVYFVRDNGAGFDMAYINKLFGAFQRLHSDDEFPGIGIGLATVNRIVFRHGGRVWAEGALETGATFYFTLN